MVLRSVAWSLEELILQPVADDRVDCTERFVHQHHRGIGRQRPRHTDPLALTPGDLGRVAVRHCRVEVDDLDQLADSAADAGLVPSEQGRDRSDVLGDGPVGEQPDLLDHISDRPSQLGGTDGTNIGSVDHDLAGCRLDQPVDHLERGGLSAPGRAHQDGDLAGGDVQREVTDGRGGGFGIDLRHPVEADHRFGHVPPGVR